MTLAELEALVLQLQTQIEANSQSIKGYATKDDLAAIQTSLDTLTKNNTTLQESVATLSTSVSKIDNLQNLLDVSISSITENDILQYSSDGKWHNIQPSSLGIGGGSGGGSATKLSELTDVYISGVNDGQGLIYDATSGKWINGNVSSNGSGDMSGYLTIKDAEATYLPLSGGTVDYITVKGITTMQNDAVTHGNLLVSKAITMYNE